MKICKGCENELLDGVTVCPFCGRKVEDDMGTHSVEAQQTERKSKGKVKGVLVTIAVLVIARLVGGFFGEFTAKNMMDNNLEKDVKKFEERIEEYVPGYCDGNEYVSEKFGFRFTIDENWVPYSEEDLKTSSKNVKASATASALESLKKDGVPQELRDTYEEAIYAATEMGALYVEDDMYVGEMTVGVLSMYGAEEISVDEYANGIKAGLSANAQMSDAFIAGSAYKVLNAKITDVNGVDTTVKMYIKIEDGMICMIVCRVMEGYEEKVFEAFENGISAYK